MKRNLCQPCREKGVVVLEFCGGWSSEPTTTDSWDLYQSSILSLLLSSATLFANGRNGKKTEDGDCWSWSCGSSGGFIRCSERA